MHKVTLTIYVSVDVLLLGIAPINLSEVKGI